jgi:hypothetical protein
VSLGLGGLKPWLGSVAQAVDEQGDHALGAGEVGVGQVGHRVQEFHGLDVAADLAGGGRGGEQRAEGGLEALLEVGGQRFEGGVAGVQRRGEAVFGREEPGVPPQPAGEGLERFVLGGQGGRGVGAGVDLVPEDGGDQVGALREVAVEGGEPDPCGVPKPCYLA